MDDQSSDRQNPYASPAIPTNAGQAFAVPSLNKPTEPLVQPIQTSGALSLEDFNFAIKLARRKTMRYVWAVLAVALLIGCAWEGYQIFLDPKELSVVAVILVFVIVSFAFLFPVLHIFGRRTKKAFAEGKGPFAYIENSIFEDGYEFREELSTGKVRWDTFSKFRYSDRIVVLFYEVNPNMAQIFSRAKFKSAEDWECFIGLLDRKLPRC
jgi:hypothetical protein